MALPEIINTSLTSMTSALLELVDGFWQPLVAIVGGFKLIELFKRAAWIVGANAEEAEMDARAAQEVEDEYGGDYSAWNEDHPEEDFFWYEDGEGGYEMDEYDIRRKDRA